MSTRFRVATVVLHRLEDLGVPLDLVLARAGLPASLRQQESFLLTTEEFFAFFRALAEAAKDPLVGLKLANEERMERSDAVSIAALCTPTFRHAVHRMARYKQLTCPEKIEVVERSGECTVQFKWLLAEEDEPDILVDLCFAWVLMIARRGTGHPLHPKRVEFTRTQSHRREYEQFFGCRVLFEAARNCLVFEKSAMDEPFQTQNPELLALVAPHLDQEVQRQLAERTIRDQVKGVLKRMMAGQRPGIREVARELRLSTRTLQRRLSGERVTFQQLLEEARRELARHYLLHSALELNETAYLLGYEDANSFFRAFHAWEGITPGQWRAARASAA